MISDRVKGISPSATLSLNAKVKEMQSKGKDIVLFGAGQPDFPTPENIKKAAVKAMEENLTGYTAVGGIPELKKAIKEKFKRDNGLDYELNEIVVSNGGKHSIYNILMALLNEGDEVMLPLPYWLSYEEQIKLAGGKPVFVETDEELKIKSELIEEALSEKTKILMLNSPNNPSGKVIEEKELRKIAELAVENNFFIVSDEVYEFLIYEGKKHYSIASFNEEIKSLTITVNAVSKTYSMTGWRIGYCAGREEVIKAMDALQGHSTSNPCSISQYAAVEAINGNQDSVKKMVKEFDERRKFMHKRLNEINGFKCSKPEGAFYCFPSIKEFGMDSVAFCKKLLDEARVAVVPGKAFGMDECVRLSYAASMKEIEEGMNRMEEWAKKQKR